MNTESTESTNVEPYIRIEYLGRYNVEVVRPRSIPPLETTNIERVLGIKKISIPNNLAGCFSLASRIAKATEGPSYEEILSRLAYESGTVFIHYFLRKQKGTLFFHPEFKEYVYYLDDPSPSLFMVTEFVNGFFLIKNLHRTRIHGPARIDERSLAENEKYFEKAPTADSADMAGQA